MARTRLTNEEVNTILRTVDPEMPLSGPGITLEYKMDHLYDMDYITEDGQPDERSLELLAAASSTDEQEPHQDNTVCHEHVVKVLTYRSSPDDQKRIKAHLEYDSEIDWCKVRGLINPLHNNTIYDARKALFNIARYGDPFLGVLRAILYQERGYLPVSLLREAYEMSLIRSGARLADTVSDIGPHAGSAKVAEELGRGSTCRSDAYDNCRPDSEKLPELAAYGGDYETFVKVLRKLPYPTTRSLYRALEATMMPNTAPLANPSDRHAIVEFILKQLKSRGPITASGEAIRSAVRTGDLDSLRSILRASRLSCVVHAVDTVYNEAYRANNQPVLDVLREFAQSAIDA